MMMHEAHGSEEVCSMVIALVVTALTLQPVLLETRPAPAAGTITISSVTGETASEQTLSVFDDAVQRALSASNFTLLPQQGHSRYTAKVMVSRRAQGVVAAGRTGGGPARASLGGGFSVGLPAGGDALNDLVITELTITLVQRSDAKEVWSGSAITARVSGTTTGSVSVIAPLLAKAVMAQFPGQASSPVSIP